MRIGSGFSKISMIFGLVCLAGGASEAYAAGSETNQYRGEFGDEISFDYPANWALSPLPSSSRAVVSMQFITFPDNGEEAVICRANFVIRAASPKYRNFTATKAHMEGLMIQQDPGLQFQETSSLPQQEGDQAARLHFQHPNDPALISATIIQKPQHTALIQCFAPKPIKTGPNALTDHIARTLEIAPPDLTGLFPETR